MLIILQCARQKSQKNHSYVTSQRTALLPDNDYIAHLPEIRLSSQSYSLAVRMCFPSCVDVYLSKACFCFCLLEVGSRKTTTLYCTKIRKMAKTKELPIYYDVFRSPLMKTFSP